MQQCTVKVEAKGFAEACVQCTRRLLCLAERRAEGLGRIHGNEEADSERRSDCRSYQRPDAGTDFPRASLVVSNAHEEKLLAFAVAL